MTGSRNVLLDETAAMERIKYEVKNARRQAQLAPVGHADRMRRLNELADKLEKLYYLTKNIEHLEEAITISRQVTEIPPTDDPRQQWRLNNLASKLCLLYLHTKNLDDLDECIKVSRRAVELTPFGEALGLNMTNLGYKLSLRYEHTRQVVNLREAFHVCGQGLQHEPRDRGIVLSDLRKLVQMAETLYQETGKTEDLDEAIGLALQIVQLMPESEWEHPQWLDKLASLVEARYAFTENTKDLTECIRMSRRVVEQTSPSHPDFQQRRENLERKLRLQSPTTGSSGGETLALQMDALQIEKARPLPQIGSQSKSVNANQLCRLCQPVFEQDEYLHTDEALHMPTPKTWILHHQENELKGSAAAGCHLCSLILGALMKTQTNPSHETMAALAAKHDFGRQIALGVVEQQGQGAIIIVAPKSKNSPFNTLATCVNFTHDTGKRARQQWHTLPCNLAANLLLEGMVYNQNVDCENYSDKMLLQMKDWVNLCKDDHDFCRTTDQRNTKERDNRRLPSRLLRIHRQSGAVSVRLESGESLPSNAEYITLSYRWSKKFVLRLTTATEASFRKQIAVTALPRSIQDAVMVADALGYQYLWVDALCIIQDSKADWLKESARMCDYYSQSALCIAACTSDPDAGFLRARNLLSKMPCKITPKGKFPTVYVRQQSIFMDNEIDPLRRLPLNDRGWVFQERLLAPRLLHFTDVEVFWECAAALSSDIFPRHIWDSARKRYLTRTDSSPAQPQRAPAMENFMAQPGGFDRFLQRGDPIPSMDVNMWTELVEEYSSLALSFERDKLVAIGGLARKAAAVTGGELGQYTAGLWAKDLPLQLGWRKHTHFPDVFLKARSTVYKAPSWSWASMNCRVTYARNFGRITPEEWFKLLEVKLESAADEYGPVTSGSLRLRGSLLPVRLARPREENEPANPEKYPLVHYLFNNTWYPGNTCAAQLDGNPLFDIPQPQGTILYALPVASYIRYEFRSLTALLLKPTGQKNGQFTRTGVLQISTDALEDFILTYHSRPKLDPRLYQEYRPGPRVEGILPQDYVFELV